MSALYHVTPMPSHETNREPSIPRYEIPDYVYTYEEEPERGSCWNCDHMAEVIIDKKTYGICVLERDVSASGDIHEAYPDTRDCKDWEDYEG